MRWGGEWSVKDGGVSLRGSGWSVRWEEEASKHGVRDVEDEIEMNER